MSYLQNKLEQEYCHLKRDELEGATIIDRIKFLENKVEELSTQLQELERYYTPKYYERLFSEMSRNTYWQDYQSSYMQALQPTNTDFALGFLHSFVAR